MDLTKLTTFKDDFVDMPITFSKFCANPAIDLYEEEGKLVAHVTVPGIYPKDMDVVINNNILTVSGERQEESEDKTKDYYTKEIRRGYFSRSIRLPKSVDAKNAEAHYADGMLTIKAPMLEREEAPGIKVNINRKNLKSN